MAAFGGHDAVDGVQIFVTARRRGVFPPASCSVRLRYEQTVGELRRAAEQALGLGGGGAAGAGGAANVDGGDDGSTTTKAAAERLLMFAYKRELTAADDASTLLQMGFHTGFGIRAYVLGGGDSGAPDFFPPVKVGSDGALVELEADEDEGGKEEGEGDEGVVVVPSQAAAAAEGGEAAERQ